jgi:hypothetical protein
LEVHLVAAEATVVAVSLASAFTFAISTSLKHASASQLADQHNTRVGAWRRFARATMTHPLWLGAIAADALGFSLQVIALHLGALALVQPLLISGLLFALFLRQRSRHDANMREIVWAVVLTAGLIGFLLVAGISNPSKPHGGINHWPAGIAVAACALLATICIILGRNRSGGAAAALLGIAVGTSYAATAALLKSVTNIALRGPVPVITSWQLYAVVLTGAAGLMLNQVAFRAGPLTASLPAIATVDPLLSIAIGIVIFHEHIRHGPFQGIGLTSLVLLIGAAAIQLSRAGQDSYARTERARLARAAAAGHPSTATVKRAKKTAPAPRPAAPSIEVAPTAASNGSAPTRPLAGPGVPPAVVAAAVAAAVAAVVPAVVPVVTPVASSAEFITKYLPRVPH